jgi:hypothetical protein
MINIENFVNMDFSKLIYMFNRTYKYPSSIDNNIWYYFNSSHTCEVIINQKTHILPIINTIIYDVNSENPDIFMTILPPHSNNITDVNIPKFTEIDGIIQMNDYAFTIDTFRDYKWNIINDLIDKKCLLSLYKKYSNQYDFTFYVFYNNEPRILKITNDFIIFMELPVMQTSVTSIAEQNIHTFSRQLPNNEIEYVFYYAKPHKSQACFNYKKTMEQKYINAKSNNESLFQWEFTINDMEYLMVVYRIQYNCLSKLHVELIDCANEIH